MTLNNKIYSLIILAMSLAAFSSNSFAENTYQSYQLKFSIETNAVAETGSDNYSPIPTAYIIGGDAVEREYPWMVAIYNSDSFICGGVLISSNWVATAAHCVYESDDEEGSATAYDTSNYSLIIGESTHYSSIRAAKSAGVTIHNLNNIVIQPNYDVDTIDYDVALLELDASYYQPGPALTIASQFDDIEEGNLLTTIGYGVTSADDNATPAEKIPTTLQEVDLPYIPENQCYWNSYNKMTDNMFCAGYSDGTDIDSCSGDSGGPVFRTLDGQLSLVGLVSWGGNTCSTYPGVYTKISKLRSWILDNIDGLQVVEQGVASYDTNQGRFSEGLISVYQYGSDLDRYLDIGDLTFDDSAYSDSLSVSDYCSNTYLYSTSDNEASCQMRFDLTDVIDEDTLFTATLLVSDDSEVIVEDDSSGDEVIVTDDNSSDSSDDDSTDTDDTTDNDVTEPTDVTATSSSSSSGGSLGFISLFALGLVAWQRRKLMLYNYIMSDKNNDYEKTI
ncbi:serine protease [Psychromonas sp. SP041]|uniref:S1 family peptidase n=1 Tax=Psychromonas sp. SP041 TaxID=1365007 RepID=UPI00040B8D4C|nr:serine protease [Psychromonas sp. SP041]